MNEEAVFKLDGISKVFTGRYNPEEKWGKHFCPDFDLDTCKDILQTLSKETDFFYKIQPLQIMTSNDKKEWEIWEINNARRCSLGTMSWEWKIAEESESPNRVEENNQQQKPIQLEVTDSGGQIEIMEVDGRSIAVMLDEEDSLENAQELVSRFNAYSELECKEREKIWILVNIDGGDEARKSCELRVGTEMTKKEIEDLGYLWYSESEFMEAFNNEEIDEVNNYITYAWLVNEK